MAAPTPLSAFTDGIHVVLNGGAFLLGALLILAVYLLILFLLSWPINYLAPRIRRWVTSKRLHRAARRSGRSA